MSEVADGPEIHVTGRPASRTEPPTAALAPGTEINVPVAFNTVLQLSPGGRFTWVLELEEQADDEWRLSFATRENQPSPTLQ